MGVLVVMAVSIIELPKDRQEILLNHWIKTPVSESIDIFESNSVAVLSINHLCVSYLSI